MRTMDEIKEQFHKQYIKRLKERKSKYLTTAYLNCKYNYRHRVKGNGRVGFCHNPVVIEKSKQFVVPCSNDEVAERCGCYECAYTEQSVTDDFHKIMRDPARCGQEYPKLAVLLWVLQSDGNDNRPSRIKRLFQAMRVVFNFSWW